MPFDHEDTEILFYRRLGGAAFQMDDPAISVNAYTRALELIENRIDPKRPSKLMGKLNTTIFDRILTPALKRTGNSEKVQRWSGNRVISIRISFGPHKPLSGLRPIRDGTGTNRPWNRLWLGKKS